ncbi:DUF397 domain-containing protein [Actinosynnema sp. NPDC047251]|uniref:DUF397 domain-containing protein n=1 Tax=Saccharothrix espanaensis (strain ATCC 51144 / DSM 44229 / JCM 9112 / NBRC 15066 / NRRL 15764) TaxID=1179773 RepID=K0KC29_SACES|nr:DUF397 domain-containing protein [Saccharothrix espanaensis]CCH34148.1 hypothetical protein BN6_69110 [Saccharothrix espanaensis DSM 44229]
MWSEWRKSSRSNGGGNCVEVARSAGAVRVRDSKNSAGPVLGFGAGAAAAFFASVKRGRPGSPR